MIRYYIAIALVAVVPRVTIGDRGDVPVEKIKLPTAITVSGKMTCNKIGVYAVLINVVEEVKCRSLMNLLLNLLMQQNSWRGDRTHYFAKGDQHLYKGWMFK